MYKHNFCPILSVEKYGALEKSLRDLENSKTEANMEKMNSLLDTVQQLQMANETFREQLMDAGIEPDPSPAAQFHSHHLLVGEHQDNTYLEENDRMKEQSLVVNQKIAHLSTEISVSQNAEKEKKETQARQCQFKEQC